MGENGDVVWVKVLKERLDNGHGRRYYLEVYKAGDKMFRWNVKWSGNEMFSYAESLEEAVDLGCTMYKERKEALRDSRDE